jgi:hypothetical protein
MNCLRIASYSLDSIDRINTTVLEVIQDINSGSDSSYLSYYETYVTAGAGWVEDKNVNVFQLSGNAGDIYFFVDENDTKAKKILAVDIYPDSSYLATAFSNSGIAFVIGKKQKLDAKLKKAEFNFSEACPTGYTCVDPTSL